MDNQERRSAVEQIAKTPFGAQYTDQQGQIVDAESFVTDLLANLRHFCDGEGLDFGEMDRLAYQHYLAQVGEERRRTS